MEKWKRQKKRKMVIETNKKPTEQIQNVFSIRKEGVLSCSKHKCLLSIEYLLGLLEILEE